MDNSVLTRKLTAILSADVKGYSRLMGDDEAATVRTLTDYRKTMGQLIQQYRGRVVDSPGDNLLADFPSVVDAVQCAVEIQRVLKAKNTRLPEDRRMEFRIGVNLGDVIQEAEQIFGDGVNIAARIESLADAGGVCISGSAYEQIENKLALGYVYMGEKEVKNIAKPVRVYKIPMEPKAAGQQSGRTSKSSQSKKRRNLVLGTAVLVILAGAFYAVWKGHLDTSVQNTEVAQEEKMAFPLPEKPSLVVLPFVNMSKDPDQEYFSDGLTEDLITDLSRFSGGFIISSQSSFRYKGKAVSPKKVSEELGVRYVLQGSVRKSGNRLRVTTQLVDATTGGLLWAERYDRKTEDIFAVQDDLTQQILSALKVKVTAAEQERAFRKNPATLNAFDFDKKGWWHYHQFTMEDNGKARRLFKKAIEMAPGYASAYTGLGFTYYEQWARQWSQDPQSLVQAFTLARKAITLDDSEPGPHALLSHVYLWERKHDQAILEQEKAIALGPNIANSYADLAEILVWAERPEEAIPLVEKAMRLNPHFSMSYLFTLGFAYFSTGRYEAAISTCKQALLRDSGHFGFYILMGLSYGELGRAAEARSHVAQALDLNPHLSVDALEQRLPFKDPARFASFAEKLKAAGLK